MFGRQFGHIFYFKTISIGLTSGYLGYRIEDSDRENYHKLVHVHRCNCHVYQRETNNFLLTKFLVLEKADKGRHPVHIFYYTLGV